MSRLEVLKTYKIYVGGQFPRTESGRYYAVSDTKGKLLGNMCLSSRKDVRNAVVAARKAFGFPFCNSRCQKIEWLIVPAGKNWFCHSALRAHVQ